MGFTFFTPGPAALYPTFEQHLKTFVENQLGSISHRSQQYRDLHKFTVDQLRTLLNVPDTHAILSAAGRHFAASVRGIRYREGSYDRHLVREALDGAGGAVPACRKCGR